MDATYLSSFCYIFNLTQIFPNSTLFSPRPERLAAMVTWPIRAVHLLTVLVAMAVLEADWSPRALCNLQVHHGRLGPSPELYREENLEYCKRKPQYPGPRKPQGTGPT